MITKSFLIFATVLGLGMWVGAHEIKPQTKNSDAQFDVTPKMANFVLQHQSIAQLHKDFSKVTDNDFNL